MPTCLVTGASRGIGLEFAKQYAADGWTVVATCRRPDQAPALAQLQGDVRIECLDVSDFARIEALGRKLVGLPIDLVLNNAAIYGPRISPYDSVDYAAWAEVMRVNVMAPLKVPRCSDQPRPQQAANGHRRHQPDGQRRRQRLGRLLCLPIVQGRAERRNAQPRHRSSLKADHRLRAHPGLGRTDMGGSAAPLEPFESVAGMRDVIDRLTTRDSGRFFNYDGDELAW